MLTSSPLDEYPVVSVLVPVRNGSRYFDKCLNVVLGNAYPVDRMEVLVMDGRSEDGTTAIIRRRTTKRSRVRLIENLGTTAPAALTVGIREARGQVLV